jgi:hypothetical protein
MPRALAECAYGLAQWQRGPLQRLRSVDSHGARHAVSVVRNHDSSEQCDVCHIEVFHCLDENFTMSLPKLTGSLFRAGRALAGLTREDLANCAGLSRDVLRSWEVSSDSIVPAQYQMLCRAIEALEAEGIRFSDCGVHLQRTAPTSTVIHSEGVVA